MTEEAGPVGPVALLRGRLSPAGLPSAVKFSSMTATTRLTKMKVAMTVYEMKYGSARREPQSPTPPWAAGSQPRASSTMQSYLQAGDNQQVDAQLLSLGTASGRLVGSCLGRHADGEG